MALQIVFNLASLFLNKENKTTIMLRSVLILIQIWLLEKCDSIQGYIILVIGFFIILVTVMIKRNKSLHKFIVATIALISIISTLLYSVIQNFLESTSVIDRLDSWKIGFRIMIDNPIFGVGVESYGNWYQRYRTTDSIAITDDFYYYNDNAHNYFIQLGANIGLIAFFIYFSKSLMC